MLRGGSLVRDDKPTSDKLQPLEDAAKFIALRQAAAFKSYLLGVAFLSKLENLMDCLSVKSKKVSGFGKTR